MPKPGGTPENLVSLGERSTEEQRKIASLGGHASVAVRREKKRMAGIYADVLAAKYTIKDELDREKEVSGTELVKEVIAAIVKRGDSASVSMIKELREGIDGNTHEISGNLDLTNLSDEQYEAMKAEWLKNNVGLLKDGS